MRPTNVFGWLIIGVALCWTGGAAAQPKAFSIDDGKVQFVSDATLEKITGSAAKLSGEIQVDPKVPKDAKGTIKLSVAMLNTGLELRDEHLHGENWLDVGHFPEAKLVIESVQGTESLKADDVVTVSVKGKLTLHGVTRDVVAESKVRWSPAKSAGQKQSLHVIASFLVHLEDYNVSIPSIVALKVARDIQVNVDLRASAS